MSEASGPTPSGELKGPKERIDVKPDEALKLNTVPQPAGVDVPPALHEEVFDPPYTVVP
jgi:hypothetical protein